MAKGDMHVMAKTPLFEAEAILLKSRPSSVSIVPGGTIDSLPRPVLGLVSREQGSTLIFDHRFSQSDSAIKLAGALHKAGINFQMTRVGDFSLFHVPGSSRSSLGLLGELKHAAEPGFQRPRSANLRSSRIAALPAQDAFHTGLAKLVKKFRREHNIGHTVLLEDDKRFLGDHAKAKAFLAELFNEQAGNLY